MRGPSSCTTLLAAFLILSPLSFAQIVPGQVVINEIDYDDAGPDNLSFIELKNVGGSPIELSDLELVGFDGNSSSGYFTWRLTFGSLASGAYWVLGLSI